MGTISAKYLARTAVLAFTTVAAAQTTLAGSNDEDFRRVRRPGSVDLAQEYTLANLQIPENEIHTLLPRDAIPALTDPALADGAEVNWLSGDARVIAVTVGKQTVGVPLAILDWHEVVNMTVGGEPVAVTYCPLCDSAAVFSRRVPTPDDGGNAESAVLEFGVSGALYNSNVLMYDRRDKALWSQLGMRAVSGPFAGTALKTLPVQLVAFSRFRTAHPSAKTVSRDTGHERAYGQSPYESYFASEGLMVPVAGVGDALPRKTLGLGVATDSAAWFIPVESIGNEYTLTTPAGDVSITRGPAGVAVKDVPSGVRTAQTFYYSWSAFYPETAVVKPGEVASASAEPGLPVGTRAPEVGLETIDGKTIQLASLYSRKPLVLTFYRGGWCPICNSALGAWQRKLGELEAAGATLVAVTPEKAANAAKTSASNQVAFTVLTDPRFEAARDFRVHFVVDDETRAKYKGYGMDVAESNTSGTWELPAPATFVIDTDGIIRYAFADWDYRKRADPEEVIDAVRSLRDDATP
jgi:peroxiredoxin